MVEVQRTRATKGDERPSCFGCFSVDSEACITCHPTVLNLCFELESKGGRAALTAVAQQAPAAPTVPAQQAAPVVQAAPAVVKARNRATEAGVKPGCFGTFLEGDAECANCFVLGECFQARQLQPAQQQVAAQVASATEPSRPVKTTAEGAKCEGLTGKGTPCKFVAFSGERFCKIHLKLEREKQEKVVVPVLPSSATPAVTVQQAPPQPAAEVVQIQPLVQLAPEPQPAKQAVTKIAGQEGNPYPPGTMCFVIYAILSATTEPLSTSEVCERSGGTVSATMVSQVLADVSTGRISGTLIKSTGQFETRRIVTLTTYRIEKTN